MAGAVNNAGAKKDDVEALRWFRAAAENGHVGAQVQLGYLLMNAIGLHNVELITSVTLLLIVFAAAVSVLLLQIDLRLHRRVQT